MHIKTLLTGILLMILLMATSSWAEMYRWVDEKGVITFKDYPPPSSKKRKKVKVYSDTDLASASPQQSSPTPATHTNKRTVARPPQSASSKSERFNGTVEIYVTEWCGYCKKAQAYMKNKNIPYVAYDIEKDSSARQRHADLGGRGVPLIIIGEHKMSGFSPEALEQYLGHR